MRISVFGLGYVGAVTAGCLARREHSIVGVDVHPDKVAAFNRGVAPIVEPGLDGLLRTASVRGRLRATRSCEEAVAGTELSIVSVGTPSTATGGLDLGAVRRVTREIAEALRRARRGHTLVFRSTMLPGSTARLVEESLAEPVAAGLVDVYYHPEFLREGTAVADFEGPSLAVVGSRDGSPPPAPLMGQLFGEAAAVVSWPVAELVKYACNAFHATKVAFANEIGRVAKRIGVDSRVVMEVLCRDTTLNVSPAYLRPGQPFGGSCLPKDVRALLDSARAEGLTLPVLESLLPSNERHLQSLLSLIVGTTQRKVVILGLAFKPDTDDLRESPMVDLTQALLERGLTVRVYEPALNLAALVGANKRVIEAKLPSLASLLCPDLGAALGERGLVVVAQRCTPLSELTRFITARHHVLDVTGWPELRGLPASYEGLCW
jgi:GDP-mannose 6-dehydrogenase